MPAKKTTSKKKASKKAPSKKSSSKKTSVASKTRSKKVSSKQALKKPAKKAVNPDVLIVKRVGADEPFDERKVYGSIYFSCMQCHYGERKAERVAERVVSELKAFLKGEKEVYSQQIFLFCIKALEKIDPEASFMYETFRDLS